MTLRKILIGVAVLAALSAKAQIPPRTIPSLTEPGEGLDVRHASPRTGLITFASSRGNGILLDTPAGASAEARAKSFVAHYGKSFGIASSSDVRLLRAPQLDSRGLEHVRLQQVRGGIPVRGGELIVHLRGSRVIAANGHAANDLPANTTPSVSAAAAIAEAKQLLRKYAPKLAANATWTEPRLEIFNRGLLSEAGKFPSRLAWFIEAHGPALRAFIWIDAQRGNALLAFNQLPQAKSRSVYTANHTSALPGTLVRSEGESDTGDSDQDNAYLFAGITYDYYFSEHGRDSFDDAGGALVSTAHYCEPGYCPSYPNAFWDGTQMVYGDGYSAGDDVVAHELTHAITERTANLLYYNQSGALNESFSDIFGETVDLLDNAGNDAPERRWEIGEDLPDGGTIRNMMDPTISYGGFPGSPAKMSDSGLFACDPNAWSPFSPDLGGVHTNSGIPNHAYALMVDGGTYNGFTITGIGLSKAAKIQYRALTTYLTSGANFIDDFIALQESCNDLIGTNGIGASDCVSVSDALLAVEMNALWPCDGATTTPALCPAGQPLYSQFEPFETDSGHWSEDFVACDNASPQPTPCWGLTIGGAKSGISSEWGQNPGHIHDHSLTLSNPFLVPPGGRFFFDHMFEFESSGNENFDAGVLEYSTNAGASWADAAAFIDAGKSYGSGTVNSAFHNPLGGRPGFVKSSFGYTGTRLDLSPLAGQSIKLRFRIGSDESFESLGWLLDNVALYTCIPGTFADDPIVAQSSIIRTIHISELRDRINSIRVHRGLHAFAWTDPVLVPGVTPVKAAHFLEMRAALGQAYNAAGVSPPVYTNAIITAGIEINKVNLDELRLAVLAIE
jgi:Zn-dependent metalloprotease